MRSQRASPLALQAPYPGGRGTAGEGTVRADAPWARSGAALPGSEGGCRATNTDALSYAIQTLERGGKRQTGSGTWSSRTFFRAHALKLFNVALEAAILENIVTLPLTQIVLFVQQKKKI